MQPEADNLQGLQQREAAAQEQAQISQQCRVDEGEVAESESRLLCTAEG